MIWFNRFAVALAAISTVGAALYPQWQLLFAALALAALLIAWGISEGTDRQNRLLVRRVVDLGGSLEGLGVRVTKTHPNLHVAAAIQSQGELATMDYSGLVRRLKADGFIYQKS